MGTAAVLSVLVQAKGIGAVNSQLAGLHAGLAKTGGAAETMAKKHQRGMDAIKNAGKIGTVAVLAVGAASLNAAGNYEKSMNVFQAVSGATGAEMKQVGAAAKRLGADVKLPGTSAKDAAEAMTELAKGGLSVKDTLAAARPVLQLSAAAQIGNAEAATITARALNAFNLKGREAGRVADLLAGASNASTAEITDIAAGLQQAGASAAQMGIPIEDLTTQLALMANAGVSGADAGTSLKTMFARLVPQTDKQANLMKKLGIDVFDAGGNFVGTRKAIEIYQKALGGMSKEQQAAAVNTLFGSDAARAANIVMLGGVDAFDKMKESVTKQGTAAKLSEAQNKGFKGSLDAFKSTLETLAITFGEMLLPAATSVMGALSSLFGKLAEHKTITVALVAVIGSLSFAIVTITYTMKAVAATQAAWTAVTNLSSAAQRRLSLSTVGTAVGLAALTVQQKIATAATWLHTAAQTAWRIVAGGQLGILTATTLAVVRQRIALAASAVAMGVVTLATRAWVVGQVLLNAAMRANPIGLVITALTALVAAVVYAYKNSEMFRVVVTAAWAAIRAVVAAAIAFIVPAVTTAWNAIKTVSTAVWGAIKLVITVVWQAIKAVIAAHIAVIKAIITAHWTVIKAITTTLWNAIKLVITTVWAGIKAVTSTVLNVLKAIITAAWNALKVVTTAIWGAIKAVITTVWAGIKSVTTATLSALKSAITASWNAIKSVTSTTWNAIRAILTTIWNAIKSLVSAALSSLKTAITTTWNAIKTVTTSVWGAVRTAIMNPVRSATEWVIAKVKWLAGALQAGFRSIWGIATDFAGGLRDRIQDAFRGVVNKIGGFINKIISIVNKIPGVDIKYKFTPLAQGGTISSAGAAGAVPAQALARGGVVNRPMAIVGEEAPRHPEYVIPTNPAYRGRATALMGAAAQKMGMEGFARGGVLGNADTLLSVAKKMGAGAKSTLALFMAGVVESGMRNLPDGDRDSRGILQIRDSTAGPMGINNMSVAQSAAAFLGRGFWNKGSAMSLARSGMSAGQVAQNTQGSAYPAAYDQQRGRALGYLKAARGDKKGLGDLLKGALSAVGDVASALNPMDFISKLPGVGDLPGWIQGLGKHAISGVSKWIKDKVASIVPSGGGGGGGSTTGLTDQVKDAVSYARSNGWSGGINSGFRSKAKQQALYDAYKSGRGNLAAPPGNSNHERGLAVDVSQPDQFARAMAKMGSGRLSRKVPGEPWHFSTTGYARGGVLDGARKAMTSPFVGSYATGGIVPRDGMAQVHKGERVTPPGRSDGPMVHIENYNVTDARHDEERLARKVGFRMRALGAID